MTPPPGGPEPPEKQPQGDERSGLNGSSGARGASTQQRARPVGVKPEEIPVTVRSQPRGRIDLRSLARRNGYFGDLAGLGNSHLLRLFPGAQEETAFIDSFRQNAQVYSSITMIGEALTSLPLLVYPGDPYSDEDLEPLDPERDEVARLFEHVNGLMDSAELKERTAHWLDLDGGAVWLLADKFGQPIQPSNPTDLKARIPLPAEIWPVSQKSAEPQLSQITGLPEAWKTRRSSGTETVWPAGSILHIKYPHPRGGVMGFAPVDVAAPAARQMHKAGVYQDAVLDNGGDPGGFLLFKSIVNEEEQERIEQMVAENYDGPGGAGQTKTLFGPDVEYIPNPTKPKDLEYGELLKANGACISEVLKVSEVLRGMRAANYAEFKGHLRVFWTLKMLPLARRIEHAINSRFLSRLNNPTQARYRVAFDLSNVEALQGEILEQIEAATKMRDLGVPANAAISAVDLPVDPIEGGDVPLVTTGLARLQDVIADPVEPEPQPAPEASTDEEEPSEDEERGLDPAPYVRTPVHAGSDLGEDSTASAERAVEDGEGGTSPIEEGSTDPAPSIADAEEEQRDLQRGYMRRRAYEVRVQSEREPNERRVMRTWRRWNADTRRAQLAWLESVAAGAEVKPHYEPDATGLRWTPPAIPKYAAERLLAAIDSRDPEEVVRWGEANERLTQFHPDDLVTAALLKTRATNISAEELDLLVLAADPRFQDALAELIEPTFTATIEALAESVASEVVTVPLQATDDITQAFLSRKLVKVKEGTTSTVAADLRRRLTEVFAEHPEVSTGTIQDKIRELLPEAKGAARETFGASHRRARTIARTEVGQIDGWTRRETFKRARVARHEWVTSGLDNVRHSHTELDGQIREVDGGVFQTPHGPLRYALDERGHPSEIINCACAMAPVFEDDE